MESIIFLSMILSAIMGNVLIHEIGHYLFGKWCGFSFVELRFLFWSFLPGKRIRFSPHMAAYTIMMPRNGIIDETGKTVAYRQKETGFETLCLILYAVGGIAANAVLALCADIAAFLCSRMPEHGRFFEFFFILMIVSALFMILNLIPFISKGEGDDGLNLLLCLHDELRTDFEKIQIISAALALGIPYRDMDHMLCRQYYAASAKKRLYLLKRYLTRRLVIANYYRLLDLGYFVEAKQHLLSEAWVSEKNQDMNALLYLEFLFLDLYFHKNAENAAEEVGSEAYKQNAKRCRYRPLINRILCLHGVRTGGDLTKLWEDAFAFLQKESCYGDVQTEIHILEMLLQDKGGKRNGNRVEF